MRYIALSLLLLMLGGCNQSSRAQFDEFYNKVKLCQSTDDNSCEKTLSLWHKLTPFIEKLQNNPQELGVSLMHLQSSFSSVDSNQDMEKKKKEEGLYYTVIRWFESPTG